MNLNKEANFIESAQPPTNRDFILCNYFKSTNYMNAAALISTHLNAPIGAVLVEADVLNSLRNGYLSAQSERANAILGSLFVEVEPRLIAKCALEANSTVKQANLLYLDTLAHAFPKCPQWESSVEFLV